MSREHPLRVGLREGLVPSACRCLRRVRSRGCRPGRGDALALLSGTWAEVQVCSEFLPFPVLGEIRNTNAATLPVEIEQVGNSLTLHDSHCAITVQSAPPLASTEIPEAFLSSLVKGPATAFLEPCESAVRFVQPWQTRVAGARLEDIDVTCFRPTPRTRV